MDISTLKIIIPTHCEWLIKRAAEVLSQEITLKTGLRLPILRGAPVSDACILLGDEKSLEREYPDTFRTALALEQPGEEGYRLVRDLNAQKLFVCGRDPRGCFYGMGHLLRKMEYTKDSFSWPDTFTNKASTPCYPLRGHQIGYRNDNNTSDSWTFEQFDRYIRDLAIFGCNAIEIFPPILAKKPYSPHYKYLPDELMIGLSRIIKSYGMDVWMWYPNILGDYALEGTVLEDAAERERAFSIIPYLDAVLVPGGDPGELSARDLFAVTARTMASLKKHHPQASIWISPQADIMEQSWLDNFFNEVNKRPDWLDGLCYGPWVKCNPQTMRRLTPDCYRIRNYPDITHSIKSQYPVPNWDGAYGMPYGREGINPRPVQFKYIHNLYEEYTIGSLTYSDGVHDDINKFLWTDQDWDPSRSARECVEDYVRCWIGSEYAQEMTEAILMLEQNWLHPIDSEWPQHTYAAWKTLHDKLPEQQRNNWRYQLLWLRACMDCYLHFRHAREQDNEEMAIAQLADMDTIGTERAIENAWNCLDKSRMQPVRQDLKFEIERLSLALYKGIGIQLDVRNFRGAYWTRGAFLENLQIPLNNYRWLTYHMREALTLSADKRAAFLSEMLRVVDPTACDVYINFGSQDSLQYLVFPHSWEEDPGFLQTPHLYNVLAYGNNPYVDYYDTYRERPMPLSWIYSVRSYYSTPIRVRIPGLQPGMPYRMSVTYFTLEKSLSYTLTTGTGHVVHNIVEDTGLYRNPVHTYDLPADCCPGGVLELTWEQPSKYDFIQLQELRLTGIEG